METPVTVQTVESVQETIQSNVVASNGWEVSIADPHDATDENEYSVVNLYKNGGNDGEVNVLIRCGDGVFVSYEYLGSSTVEEIGAVDDLIEYLNSVME